MGSELAQTCGTCAHRDSELEICRELHREPGFGIQTTWDTAKVAYGGFVEKGMQRGELYDPIKSEDRCHFSDGLRWVPRQREQGPDGI